jgi:hypothetical protein
VEKKLYNTYVISIDSFSAVELIGESLGVDDAQTIEVNESRRRDSLDFFVQSYIVGSDRDLECKKELKKLAKQLA